ncbi:MAG: AraC family transcriptional regulator [Pseudomonadota bacterium]
MLTGPTSNDSLSDVVRSLDLTGGVFLDAELSAPWAITAHVTEEDCRPFMPVPRQVLAYHVVTDGQAIVSLDRSSGYRTHHLARAGDVVLLPSNALHILASESGETPVSGDDLLLAPGDDGLVRIRHGGGGACTKILCGFMAARAGPVPLFNTLPSLLVISIETVATLNWIEASIAFAARELSAGRVAAAGVTARLSEILLIEALRAHLEQTPRPTGWLAGMADPRIAKALALVHGELGRQVSVTSMAEAAGLSRSAFVERFTATLGVGPRQYVLDQRIASSQALLRETNLSTTEIAYRVGYHAPEAFSRAFKRVAGRTPAQWREHSLD